MDLINKYKPKNLGDWAIVFVLGGAAAISFGILKKFEFESDNELEVNLGGYKLETELEYDFEIERANKHGKGGKRRR